MDFLLPSMIHMMKNPPRAGVLLNLLKYKMAERKETLSHAPISLVFYVTKRCNYKCEFCFTYSDLNKADWEKFELTPETFSELLSTEYGKKSLRVGFLGGEPLMNRNLETMLDIAHKKGKITTVVTNASMLTEERLEKLSKSYPTMLGISLYDNNFTEVAKVSNALAEKKKFFWVQSVVDATALGAILAKIEFAKKNKIKNLILSNYHPGYSGNMNKVIYSDDQRFHEISIEANKLAEKYKIKLTLPNPIERTLTKRSCNMPFSYMHVDSDGSIGPCCMRAPNKSYGNLKNSKDWNTEYFKKLRSSFIHNDQDVVTDCRYCENFGRDLYGV